MFQNKRCYTLLKDSVGLCCCINLNFWQIRQCYFLLLKVENNYSNTQMNYSFILFFFDEKRKTDNLIRLTRKKKWYAFTIHAEAFVFSDFLISTNLCICRQKQFGKDESATQSIRWLYTLIPENFDSSLIYCTNRFTSLQIINTAMSKSIMFESPKSIQSELKQKP